MEELSTRERIIIKLGLPEDATDEDIKVAFTQRRQVEGNYKVSSDRSKSDANKDLYITLKSLERNFSKAMFLNGEIKEFDISQILMDIDGLIYTLTTLNGSLSYLDIEKMRNSAAEIGALYEGYINSTNSERRN